MHGGDHHHHAGLGDQPSRRGRGAVGAVAQVNTSLDPAFQPVMTKADFKTKYPYLDPEETLDAFRDYYIAKGARSHDWTAQFRLFAQYRNTRARLDATRETDSMGLPNDPVKRATMQTSTEGDFGIQFMEAIERHLKQGLSFDEAHAAATAELEGESQ